MMDKISSFLKYNHERIRRQIRFFRNEGALKTARRIAWFVGSKIYFEKEGFLFVLDRLEVTPEPPVDIDYEVEEIKCGLDLSHLKEDLTERNVQTRIEGGEIGFVAIHQGKPIGTVWVTEKPAYFPGVEFRFASKKKWLPDRKGEVYLYRGVVDPAFRGKRIMLAMFNACILKSRELGVGRMVTSSGSENAASRKAAVRVGWKITERVSVGRILGIPFRKVVEENPNPESRSDTGK